MRACIANHPIMCVAELLLWKIELSARVQNHRSLQVWHNQRRKYRYLRPRRGESLCLLIWWYGTDRDENSDRNRDRPEGADRSSGCV